MTRNEAREQIALLSAKIDHLEYILSQDLYNVKIHFFSGKGHPDRYNVLSNDIIPFSLSGELTLLIGDSIEELKRQRENCSDIINGITY
jgi:hypothetical protein